MFEAFLYCFVILLWLSTIGAAFALGRLSSAPLPSPLSSGCCRPLSSVCPKFDSDDETQTAELWMSPAGKVIHTSPECSYLRNSMSKLVSISQCCRCSNKATLQVVKKNK